jgi:Lantibiotic dehydratase, N terminus
MFPLAGGPFLVWPEGVIRGSGFPIADLVALGDDDYVAAVDRFLAVEAKTAETRTTETRTTETRTTEHDELTAARDALTRAAKAAEYRQAELLAAVARRVDFQEAVTWQNHSIVDPMIVGLAAAGPETAHNQRFRKKQRIVVKYWARYCAKNETIGFFGPACWFTFRDDGAPVVMRPGADLARAGEAFLEPWAVDTLAATLAGDPRVRPWVAPRPHPAIFLAGTSARTLTGPVQLAPAEAAVLRRLDGKTHARDVATAVLADADRDGHDLAKSDDVYRVLDDLVARELAFWDLEPPLVQRAERVLRRRLEEIGDADTRAWALDRLDRLEAARDELAGYRTPAELGGLLSDLDTVFTGLTGVDPVRRQGQVYGGRQLTYLDCSRDLDLSIAPTVLDDFAEPLSLLLISSRWFAHEAAQRLRATLNTAFDAMTAASGVDTVGFNELTFSCADQIFIPGHRPLDKLIAEFGARWREILDMDSGAHVVEHSTETIRARLEQAFPGGRPSWAWAWNHSVDLHLAATSVDALARGDYQPIIGEVHTTHIPFETPYLVNAHPDQERLRRLAETGVPDTRVMLTPVKDFPRVAARVYPSLHGDRDWWLCVSRFPGGDPQRRLPLCGLQVRRVDGELAVGVPGQDKEFDVAEVCGTWMAAEVMDALKYVVRGHRHSPRVLIDKLVVFRETWSIPVSELTWISTRTDHEHFVAARRWTRELGLPRFVFAAISSELKPLFVDFHSEVQVANLAQLLRSAADTPGATVALSEMLPGPEQAWLADAEGNRYTSELRLEFVDSGEATP